MKIALIFAGVLIALIVLVAGVGYALPVRHRATRAITLHVPAHSIFAALVNPAAFPEWRKRVKRVEMLTRADGLTSYRETGDDGAIVYVVDEADANARLVTRIADDNLPFGGKWTYQLSTMASAPSGAAVSSDVSVQRASGIAVQTAGPAISSATQLRITEDGEVYNPVFRFMSRFVFGHHATIDTYLTDVAAKFGERAAIVD